MLINQIKKMIRETGPLPLETYMDLCASAYYESEQTIGRQGDFITAPEISSLFGEMIGIWALDLWHKLSAPPVMNIVELGPGRGTLMKDLRRVLQQGMGQQGRCHIHLIERSLQLQTVQCEALGGDGVSWHKSLGDFFNLKEQGPTIFIGNEFLDALPIHQYMCVKDTWYSRDIGLIDEALTFQRGSRPADIPKTANPDLIYECSPQAQKVVTDVADYISAHGGGFLWVDYGYMDAQGDTLQSLGQHEYTNPLANPGVDDITAHVDFGALQKVLPSEMKTFYADQGDFLAAMGLALRVAQLKQGQPKEAREKIDQAVERLTLKNDPKRHMGGLFKVLGGVSSGLGG